MRKQTFITDYVILRGIAPNGLKAIDCPRGKPLQVYTLLDEERLLAHLMPVHNFNVFIEDYVHDWQYRDGKLYYYSRVGELNDIVLVYGKEERVPVARFCSQTGKPLDTTSN